MRLLVRKFHRVAPLVLLLGVLLLGRAAAYAKHLFSRARV